MYLFYYGLFKNMYLILVYFIFKEFFLNKYIVYLICIKLIVIYKDKYL